MSRKTVLRLCCFFTTVCAVFASGNKEKTTANEVIIWTYDSFNSEWGPGPTISTRFFDETGITIKWVSHGDAGALLSRLLLDGQNADADILMGIDQNYTNRALASSLLAAYKPAGAESVFPELLVDPSYRLIPFDYSYFAIVYDSDAVPNPPKSLEDLTNPVYAKKLILMDPRTSSPGLGFLTWTKAVYGAEWKQYWRRLAPSILTIAEGWDSGYGLFTAGEAPMVLSYTTSPGYHLEYEGTERYRAALFNEGHPIQIELAGLLSHAKHPENARRFLDFMLSASFQEVVPLTNWMYPVIAIPLPDSFKVNPKSDKPLRPSPLTQADINEWAALMSER
jgi:thiamine transport system substrate-binding protein